MKVAFATQDMQRCDAHFASARNMAVYDISADGWRFLEALQFDTVTDQSGEHAEGEDRLLAKVDALAGCAILFVLAIGGPAAARVIQRKVHPIKLPAPEPISSVLERLQSQLAGSPPPWMRKILNQGASQDFLDGDD